jgi:hypothetical protein
MNTHTQMNDLLPLYISGAVDPGQRLAVEEHLLTCSQCQADLLLWQAVSNEIQTTNQVIPAPIDLAERALQQIHTPGRLGLAFLRAWQLLRTQAFLVQADMWPASAAVMAMGVIVALIADRAGIIYFLAPLVAASTLAVIYGPEHDPALELTLSTPTSPWKILLARLSVVSAYNFLLSILASFVLLFIVPSDMLGAIILGWLGPLAFLSAMGLLLSIWLGTGIAVAITYGLWLLQFIPFKIIGLWMDSPAWTSSMAAYQQFWHNPLLLLALALLLSGLALGSAQRSGPGSRLTQIPG